MIAAPALPDKPLTAAERSRFTKLDKAVQPGMGAFVVVGMALKEIRDRKPYRAAFDTVEQYVGDRHDLGRRTAYQLIDAADTVHHIEVCANCAQLPAMKVRFEHLLLSP